MQVENNFKKLKIFERKELNLYCDLLVHRIKEITGVPPYLVGSVAKILSGHLPEDYEIKDIDFIVSSLEFRKLLPHRNTIFPEAKSVEMRPERLILHLENFAIEIWNSKEKNTDKTPKIYKHKIHYLCLLQQEPKL